MESKNHLVMTTLVNTLIASFFSAFIAPQNEDTISQVSQTTIEVTVCDKQEKMETSDIYIFL